MLYYCLGATIGGLISCVICYFLAKYKNRNKILWPILGFITGIIGLIILLLIPKKLTYNEVMEKCYKPDDNF